MALSLDIEKTLGAFRLRVRLETEDEVTALLGASGSGKSVTLRCVAGILTPDRGRIVLNGKTLFDSEKKINLPPQQRRVGYLFQQYALFPHMTAAQNIACGVRDRARRSARVSELLRAMRLEDAADLYPRQLSGGQQQRVALARILANEPEALLLDEPFSALDSHLRFQLEQELRGVLRTFRKPVLLVSHDRDEAFRLSHTIAILRDGGIESHGAKDAVFRDPKTVYGARLTGCKNISPAVPEEGGVFAVDWNLHLKPAFDPAGVTHVGIRMHDVRPGGGENAVVCIVEEVIENPFSHTVMLRPDGASAPFGMELNKAARTHNPGERVTVSLPPEAILPLCEKGTPE